MKVFVTGGAGYIGAITAFELTKAGHQVVVFDHLQNHQATKLGEIPYFQGDLLNPSDIESALNQAKPDAVIHFAAYIQMGESVQNPRKYYENNFLGSYHLANACVDQGINKLVFSSSAGVYGNPDTLPVPEDACQRPTNPYGETKLAIERLFRWYESPYGLRSISIRYFNAAGATEDGQLGEDHQQESHLIPNVILAQKEGREFTLFGNDYPTKDGTCVRDYIHVVDLASAHIKALDALSQGVQSTAYNAGTGVGYSNLEVIKMVEEVSGKPVQIKIEPRREGDASELVADVSKINKELNWSPQYSDLKTIVTSAWQYHTSH